MIQGQVVDGRFECRSTTTRPEPGESWIARDGDRDVVLRILPGILKDEAAKSGFLGRVGSATKIIGGSVEKVLHSGFTADDRPYIVTEKISGRFLADELSGGSRLDVDRAIDICQQITAAVAEADQRGCIHGHLSPSVVILQTSSRKGKRRTHDNRVKIIGFAPWGATLEGTRFPNDATAPEVIDGADADIISDMWSVGATLYWMLTGRNPSHGNGGKAGASPAARGPIEPPSAISPDANIPPALDMITMRLLERNPARRLSSPEQLAAHLKSIREADDRTQLIQMDSATTEETRREPDSAENDLDEGISFASGHKVKTTGFYAAAIAGAVSAPDVAKTIELERLQVPQGSGGTQRMSFGGTDDAHVKQPKKTGTGEVPTRPGRNPVIAIVVLAGFFLIAAIIVTGWFVLQYQARQLEMAGANIPAAAAAIAPAQTPAPAQAPAAAQAPAQTQAQPPAEVPAPATAPAAEPASEPAVAPTMATATAATPDPAPAAAVRTRPVVKRPASAPAPRSAAARPGNDTAGQTGTRATNSRRSAQPNWNDGLDEADEDAAPARPRTGNQAPKPASTNGSSLDWGDGD